MAPLNNPACPAPTQPACPSTDFPGVAARVSALRDATAHPQPAQSTSCDEGQCRPRMTRPAGLTRRRVVLDDAVRLTGQTLGSTLSAEAGRVCGTAAGICLRAGLRRAGRAGHEDRGGGTRPREAPITFLREEPAISQRQSPTRPDRILFCAAVTGADYALRSPSVRRYGYGTPQSLRWLGDPGRKGPPSTRYRHPYSPSTTYLIAARECVAGNAK